LPEAQPGPAAAAALCVLSRGRRARGEGAARPAHVAASRPARLTCLVEAAQLVESTSGPGRVTRPIGARPASTPGTRGTAGHPAQPGEPMGRFLFLYFLKLFFTEIYFWFYNLQLCTPTAGRPAPCRLPGGRDQNINKIYIFVSGGACRPSLPGGRYPPPTGEAVGQPAARQGAAGSPLYIKGLSSPSLSFSSHDIQRGGGRKER